MKKFLVLGTILGALILTGAGCSMGSTAAPQTSSPTASSESNQISIANFSFGPASITVKAGTTVKWTNDDQVMHNIKSDDGSFTDSANLNTGNSYEFKFDKPGTYNYSCGLHSSMHGQVIVQ